MKRSRARIALGLMGVSVLVYWLLQHWTFPFRDAVDQVLLILAGVAASAVFLPELSSDLWRFSRDEVEKVVPLAARESLMRSLLAAGSRDQEWSDLVHDQAVMPLLAAAATPDAIVKNMDYTIEVHLHNEVAFGDRRLRIHNVETLSSSERVLPPRVAAGFFISVARTETALDGEFRAPGCLSRELVDLRDQDGDPLPTAEWRRAMEQLCQVMVTINGQPQTVTPRADAATDVYRWYFSPEGEEVDQRVPIRVSFDFPLGAEVDQFPAMFSGYYCAGSTVVTMKVYGQGKEVPLRCHRFFAHGLGPQSTDGEITSNAGALCTQASFSTGRKSILWPGSGVIFDWHDCRHHA